jgi:hypothetical protein
MLDEDLKNEKKLSGFQRNTLNSINQSKNMI